MSSPAPSEQIDAPSSQDEVLSPQLPTHTSPRSRASRKERRQPSITPRRFSRFFDAQRGASMSSPSGRALKAIVNNRQSTQSSPLKCSKILEVDNEENESPSTPREFKRRKRATGDSELDEACLGNLAKRRTGQMLDDFSISPFPDVKVQVVEDFGIGKRTTQIETPTKRITPFENRGFGARLLQSSLGIHRSRQPNLAYPVNDWRDETASFYSRPEDVHHSRSLRGDRDSIPFCNAGLHTIGDDEGRIRLVESEKEGKPSFSTPYLGWRIHKNAIIDLDLSEDDSLLATGSGDQSAKVTDMTTQTTLSILSGHTATLKQVRFQPGANNKNILATSGRDGCVQLWDLRCKGDDGAVLDMQRLTDQVCNPTACGNINSIVNAHHPLRNKQSSRFNEDGPGRSGISVTAIHFLPPGREHLLLTASETDSVVKLWDIRNPSIKRRNIQPVACTAPPPTHIGNRPFGVTSLSIGHDGSRFYSVCKDSTVYAYSTSHLILGRAPELEPTGGRKRCAQRPTLEGSGPLYGFRNPSLHVSTFYIKSAIRRPVNGHTELLAIGSNDGTPILFPTDERYLSTKANSGIRSGNFPDQSTSRALGCNQSAGSGGFQPETWESKRGNLGGDAIPIYTCGTALVRGHGKEVSALSWTSNGELICADDEWDVRCWREGEDAKDLRLGGESEGRRWRCGWADVGEDYDLDE
ncbi:WD domain protein [Rutstroemia sp. NJR-2017a BBW]|nr:WD domain protein [Rutstroemia sp. NJR-2017a BBW]